MGCDRPRPGTGTRSDLVAALDPDLVLLVADAGLGTINAVRLSLTALCPPGSSGRDPIVVLDRFDVRHDLHRRNREWLAARDGDRVLVVPGEEGALADLSLAAGRAT